MKGQTSPDRCTFSGCEGKAVVFCISFHFSFSYPLFHLLSLSFLSLSLPLSIDWSFSNAQSLYFSYLFPLLSFYVSSFSLFHMSIYVFIYFSSLTHPFCISLPFALSLSLPLHFLFNLAPSSLSSIPSSHPSIYSFSYRSERKHKETQILLPSHL